MKSVKSFVADEWYLIMVGALSLIVLILGIFLSEYPSVETAMQSVLSEHPECMGNITVLEEQENVIPYTIVPPFTQTRTYVVCEEAGIKILVSSQ
jgi:hypothetical protein